MVTRQVTAPAGDQPAWISPLAKTPEVPKASAESTAIPRPRTVPRSWAFWVTTASSALRAARVSPSWVN